MTEPSRTEVEAVVAAVFRDEWGRVVATLIRATGDWDVAEEATQDAFTRALRRWPLDGIPANPGAWITTTARNRAVDLLRRSTVGAAKVQEAVVHIEPEEPRVDESGIAFAAIQGLNKKVERENEVLRRENADLRGSLERIVARIERLEGRKGD